MPVHRIGTGRGENVHAFSEEFDAWLATAARSRDLRDQPGDAEAPEATGERRAGYGSARFPRARPDAPPVDPAIFDRRRHRAAGLTWLTLTAVVLAAGATARLAGHAAAADRFGSDRRL